MGSNDHTPNKQQRTQRRRRGEVHEILVWNDDNLMVMLPLISAISQAGGYIGLGRNSKGDCLLIYIKLDDWIERVPIEDVHMLPETVADILADL